MLAALTTNDRNVFIVLGKKEMPRHVVFHGRCFKKQGDMHLEHGSTLAITFQLPLNNVRKCDSGTSSACSDCHHVSVTKKRLSQLPRPPYRPFFHGHFAKVIRRPWASWSLLQGRLLAAVPFAAEWSRLNRRHSPPTPFCSPYVH